MMLIEFRNYQHNYKNVYTGKWLDEIQNRIEISVRFFSYSCDSEKMKIYINDDTYSFVDLER